MSAVRERLATSPYLLVGRGEGSDYFQTIDGRASLPVTKRYVELLEIFIDSAPAEAGDAIDRDGSMRCELVGAGMLVGDLEKHRRDVFGAFERRFRREEPRIGYIETTSRCPFTCVMCPKSSSRYDRQDADMNMRLFEQIVGELRWQDEVALHLFGDPLMDPFIFDRVSVVRRHGLRSVFSTNAMLLKSSLVEELLASGPDRLIISCDAISEATYRGVRGARARFSMAEPRLEEFLDSWTRSCSDIEVVLRFVNLDRNLSERDAFVERWSHYPGVEIDVKEHLRFPDVEPLLDRIARRRQGRMQFFRSLVGRRAPVKCSRHWFSASGELAVQVDGSVVPCCLCHSQEVVLGRLGEQTLKDIWHGERFTALRRAVFFREDLESFSICDRCNYDMP